MLGVQKCWGLKNVGSSKVLGAKNVGVKIVGSSKMLGVQKCWELKNVGCTKMLRAQNVGSSKMLVWLAALHFRNGIGM